MKILIDFWCIQIRIGPGVSPASPWARATPSMGQPKKKKKLIVKKKRKKASL
jgi:hypothetical protein